VARDFRRRRLDVKLSFNEIPIPVERVERERLAQAILDPPWFPDVLG
jgi:hypothetical protein